jgi:hypothetical protein
MSWELTGNHYLALPCISLPDGAIHAANVGHRGMACLVSWTGEREPAPDGVPLARLRVVVEGVERALADVQWERLDRWVPRLTAELGDGVRLVLTHCTPGGFDPLARGGVVVAQLHNGTGRDMAVRVWLEGCWRWTLRTVASTRPLRCENRLSRGASPDGLALEAGEAPGSAALAFVLAGPGVFYEAGPGDAAPAALDPGAELATANGTALRFRVGCERRLKAASRTSITFVLGVAPERDGALATAARLSEFGGEDLVRRARLDLASLNRGTDDAVAREIVARNLAFHHYYGAVRALDDDRLYPVQSRAPGFGACAAFGEREALAWSLPAYTLTDPTVGRELLMRALEVWSDRAGLMRRYLDGGVMDSAFSLGRLCDWALALERYVDMTRDESLAGEPLVQQVLHELDDVLWNRLHPEVFLCSTDALPGGETADHPWCAFDNVLAWRACSALQRFWQVEPPPEPGQRAEVGPRMRHGDEEIQAAFWQRFTTEVEGLQVIACTTDLRGNAAVYDDPAGSLRLLPWLGFCAADDPIWSNTMELLHSASYPLWHGRAPHPGLAGRSRPAEASFAALCSDLLGPRRGAALEVLRTLDLPGDVACATFDPATGRVASGPWAAAQAGYLAWALLEQSAQPVRGKKKKER